MEWKRDKETWTSGLFKITKRFRYFVLKFNNKTITQKPSLESAQEEAKKINNDAKETSDKNS